MLIIFWKHIAYCFLGRVPDDSVICTYACIGGGMHKVRWVLKTLIATAQEASASSCSLKTTRQLLPTVEVIMERSQEGSQPYRWYTCSFP
jgi:hypothetical protein